jgi:hypothetical protein
MWKLDILRSMHATSCNAGSIQNTSQTGVMFIVANAAIAFQRYAKLVFAVLCLAALLLNNCDYP